MIKLSFKRLTNEFNDIELPLYQTPDSSGMDIRAAIQEQISIPSLSTAIVPTNLAVEIPKGFEIQVRPRSGLAAKHGVTVLNSPGTIDADYRGEIKVLLINFGKDTFVVSRGERIAQLVLSQVFQAEISSSSSLTETERADGGFGSTGKH